MNQTTTTAVESATVSPQTRLAVLSSREVENLCAAQDTPAFDLFRRCALAVLTSGLDIDDPRIIAERFAAFNLAVEAVDRGIVLHVENAPASAFVDGEMIAGLREHLFSVLRDLVYVDNEIRLPADESTDITEMVFRILRQADLVRPSHANGIAVCWGGHSIRSSEYDYTKEVGYQLGLRGLDICTGCGPGAMKGPMKGATIAHAKQRKRNGRYIGISEPGIIAAEAPNAIVNELAILPDIEKRLEAFVRLGHAMVVFPGGVGTLEEILYLLGILSHPDNQSLPMPVVFTGPEESRAYFEVLDEFLCATLGESFRRYYEIIVGDPVSVARTVRDGIAAVMSYRDAIDDAQYFNWALTIEDAFQAPFDPTHENMRALQLSRTLPDHVLASNLRRAFSGIVAGNVKEVGIRAVETHGPFKLRGDSDIATGLDNLLRRFVAEGRMRLPGTTYTPVYDVEAASSR